MDEQFSKFQKINTFMENIEVTGKTILLLHLFSHVTGLTVPNSYFLHFVHINQNFVSFFCSMATWAIMTALISGKQGRI